ncbi:MAG: 3-deoxy-8-phosphooctulonate synthase [Planctomycetes bacterium GWF2_42_9]|nr:MAG: 3-deoxy-8-phosphooctulonate synthase [Planctomycetes bacterium GWF2_42_9]HAL46039.1 3-deoxy-8-phosphooctulonate synthase [Phycisphaerales bacterium]
MFKIGNIEIESKAGLFVIAGPCVIESEQICLDIAFKLLEIGKKTNTKMIFKASFDKANRSSIESFRGPGMEKGLAILEKVRKETSLPILTDVHEVSQAAPVAEVVDCLQIPAFLCRQTDLLAACGKTGKPVNVKKGQFVSPEEMKNAVAKIRSTGNDKIMLTDRGTFFGYNRLVNDMTCIPIMQKFGCPVIFDATHSTQQPGGLGTASGGCREMAPVLAKAAVAAGADGLFLEVHTDYKNAKSDAAIVMPIDWVENLLAQCTKIYNI